MTQRKYNDAGLSNLNVLLGLIIIGLVSSITWYIWHNNQQPAQLSPVNTTSNPEATRPSEVAPGSRVESVNKAFSIVVPGGWGIDVHVDKDLITSTGAHVDNYSVGGFLITPSQPVVVSKVSDRDFDVFSDRFAVFTEGKFVQKRTNEKATKSDFGPVDGVVGTKYYQKLEKELEDTPNSVEGYEIYEYSFAKNNKNFHVYYAVFANINNPGTGDKNQIDIVENAIRSLIFY